MVPPNTCSTEGVELVDVMKTAAAIRQRWRNGDPWDERAMKVAVGQLGDGRWYARRWGGGVTDEYIARDALPLIDVDAVTSIAHLDRLGHRHHRDGGMRLGVEHCIFNQRIERSLDQVKSLDEDRILRSFLLLIRKSLRTNYFQADAAGSPKPYLSVKLASREVELLPRTRLQPDTRHRFVLDPAAPVERVRLDVLPDGGMARLRLWGRPSAAGRAALGRRWFDALPDVQQLEVLRSVGVPAEEAGRLIGRPLPESLPPQVAAVVLGRGG